MTKKICISGYYGFDNFGDETILKILVENTKSYDCHPEITVFSSNPEKTSASLDIKSVHSFDIKSVLQELYSCDCLISGGGSLLQDVTSKKSLIYYLVIIAIAKILGKKIIIFAQGIGPIHNKILAFLTKCILKKAKYITVRDNNSLNLLNNWKINAIKCNDPVWNLNIEKKENTNKIGIQLRDFHQVNNEFITQLALCINNYYKDKEINIFSFQNKIDMNVCNNLKNTLTDINPDLKVKIIENTSNEKIIKDISEMEVIIAMRYHACLIAIKAGIKLLPLSYDIKVEHLAKEFNLKYIDINNPISISKVFDEFVKSDFEYDKEQTLGLAYNFKEMEKNI